MGGNDIFVGRQRELERFQEVLADPGGQAVVVVGPAAMGKTWLLNEMQRRAGAGLITSSGKTLECGVVRYQVTESEGVDTTLALMMDHAFEAAGITERSFEGTDRRLEQWRSFLNVLKIGDLVLSLRRDVAKHARDQFIERMELISKRMKNNQRAIFIVDPEKYMSKGSDGDWGLVTRALPRGVKLVFGQRPDDVLVGSEVFGSAGNVVWIPEGKHLDVLDSASVEDLLDRWTLQVSYDGPDLRECLGRYEGHPYALGAALRLLEAGTAMEDLPEQPEPQEFAKKQWEKISERGDEAIRLFEALAVLEVPVPDDVIEAVGGLNSTTRKRLMNDRYLKHLVRQEGEGQRIYHAILADVILGRMSDQEKRRYHARAVEVYRGKLKKAKGEQTRPDELSAVRLCEHVRVVDGDEGFVQALANECVRSLLTLGLLETAERLCVEGLAGVEKGTGTEAGLLGNLANVYSIQGKVSEAERVYREAMSIHKTIGNSEALAADCSNLGSLYRMQGRFNDAEQLFQEALAIDKTLGNQAGVANEYGNLGNVYRYQGKFQDAVKMYKKALQIEQELNNRSGIARILGNLGIVYRMYGKYDLAEGIFQELLEIHGELGLQQGTANDYNNLGIIYGIQKRFDEAEAMYEKGLAIAEKIGWREGLASGCGNLGTVYYLQDKIDKAEAMFSKALGINEEIASQDGIANSYGNLGLIYEARGDVGRAREYWGKALEIFKRIGMPHMVEKVQGWIEGSGEK